MTKKEQLQKDLELQAETIGYLRERIAELEEKLERKECGNKLLADKLEDVTKVKIELEQKLEQIKDEKFGKALSQIKHDREVVIEYNERLQKENTELKEQLKTSYRKGMRHMAKALKDYDRTDGAWTDYFEHTVDKVLQRELVDFEENGTLVDQITKAKELLRKFMPYVREAYLKQDISNIKLSLDEITEAEQFFKYSEVEK